jgi:hypothetical protein
MASSTQDKKAVEQRLYEFSKNLITPLEAVISIRPIDTDLLISRYRESFDSYSELLDIYEQLHETELSKKEMIATLMNGLHAAVDNHKTFEPYMSKGGEYLPLDILRGSKSFPSASIRVMAKFLTKRLNEKYISLSEFIYLLATGTGYNPISKEFDHFTRAEWIDYGYTDTVSELFAYSFYDVKAEDLEPLISAAISFVLPFDYVDEDDTLIRANYLFEILYEQNLISNSDETHHELERLFDSLWLWVEDQIAGYGVCIPNNLDSSFYKEYEFEDIFQDLRYELDLLNFIFFHSEILGEESLIGFLDSPKAERLFGDLIPWFKALACVCADKHDEAKVLADKYCEGLDDFESSYEYTVLSVLRLVD